MSAAILHSRAQLGTAAPPVTIEVFLSGGLPVFSIVGMPATAVRESKDRVRSALLSAGFSVPQERITVSLGPADMPKTGGRFDLAIALGILVASRQLKPGPLANCEFYGELGLNGDLRAVPGVLPAAMRASAAGRQVLVPRANVNEATLVSDAVYAAGSLLEVTGHFTGSEPLPRLPRQLPEAAAAAAPDLADVRGQGHAKRALEIAAAGGHSLLLTGPPGTGKSMLAARLPGILPAMEEDEALETAAVESLLGHPPDPRRWRVRPFRAPHHTASAAALIGGGAGPRPGEVSRAHNGVLFLDELPEFRRNVLDVLREPLEVRRITISRANRQSDFPAAFQLVAAMNPCPCGYAGDESGRCACSAERIAAYCSRISGPLLDRIDLRVQVSRLPRGALRRSRSDGEPSVRVQQRVVAARERQLERAGTCNARLDAGAVERYCEPDTAGWHLLESAADRLVLSTRACQRILRVARTIADLAGADDIDVAQVAEAISLRAMPA